MSFPSNTSARAAARDLVSEALRAAVAAGDIGGISGTDLPEPSIERPKRSDHGDFATNIALALSKRAATSPANLAAILIRHLMAIGSETLAEATIAGPGFINLRFSDDYWRTRLGDVLHAGPDWGRASVRSSPRVNIEYLSANPTGPLHFAHGRIAAVGDCLTRLMKFAGYSVTSEFYVNDAGNQVAMLAQSVWARYMEAGREQTGDAVPPVGFPDNGYKGEYIRVLARKLWREVGSRFVASAMPDVDALQPIRQFAIDECLGLIRASLTRFDVGFDVWQSERALHASGDVTETLTALDKAGFIERRDDAVWLKTTALWGDDKDRVVVKSDGQPTYLLADIAYHRKKIERGFDVLCDIWGADHHGHIPRMKAALKAFGHDPDRLGVILIQMVSLVRDGKPVAMGKREGEFITLDEVVDEVGRDATRFFYLMRRHDTSLEFDLDLAKKQSMDNPVYYAQYAHARCAAILRRAEELQAPIQSYSRAKAAKLTLPEEIAILRLLVDFPDFVADAAAAREPHRLTTFVADLAGAFQSYYTQLQKVHGDTILPQEHQRTGDYRATWDWDKTAARLLWVKAVEHVLATALGLLGVSAPERMQRAPERDEGGGTAGDAN